MTPELLQFLVAQPAIVVVVVIAYWLLERGHKRELLAAQEQVESEKLNKETVNTLMLTVLASQDANTKALAELRTTLESISAAERRLAARQNGSAT